MTSRDVSIHDDAWCAVAVAECAISASLLLGAWDAITFEHY